MAGSKTSGKAATKKEYKKKYELDCFGKAKTGAPPKFTTAEKFEEKVQEYFRKISYIREHRRNNVDGEPIYTLEFVEPPSITGLCLFLGISPETFNSYHNGEKFSEPCEWAKLMVENYLAKELVIRNTPVGGVKFALENNFGWKNRQEFSGDSASPLVVELKGDVSEWAE